VISFTCISNTVELDITVPNSLLGGNYVNATCFGNITTFNANFTIIPALSSTLCLIQQAGIINQFITPTINVMSPTTFSVSCYINIYIVIPITGNIPVTIQLTVRYPLNTSNSLIPYGSATFYTPVFWNYIECSSKLFCSSNYITVYGQFVINPSYDYAFNFSIDGVENITNWVNAETLSSKNYIDFRIPLNGDYSFAPQTQFNYYSLLQRYNGYISTAFYYYGINNLSLPINFFINSTCPIIKPYKPSWYTKWYFIVAFVAGGMFVVACWSSTGFLLKYNCTWCNNKNSEEEQRLKSEIIQLNLNPYGKSAVRN